MTKEAWIEATRRIVEDAFAVDPLRTEEVITAIFGGPVFSWTNITTRNVRALHGALFSTARLA